MCGIRSKIFLLLLAVLLLQPCSSVWADVVYTEAQVTALNLHLDELEKELKSAKQKLSEQKSELNQAKSELSKAKKELTEANSSLEKSRETLTEQKDTLKQLEKSLQQERKQTRWGKVKAFAIGAVLGAAGGFAGAWYMLK